MHKKTVLPNGLRLLTVLKPKSLATTVLILVEAGSEYENKENNGISHFLEHLVFKGTKKRPEVGQIARELDALGASTNAFTAQEYTGYYAKAQEKHSLDILEIISDLYLNPIFNPAEIEKERGVVVEEINMYEDLPMRRVHEYFASLLYGEQPAGWDIAGKKEIIRRLSRDEIVNYRSTHYIPQKTVVVVAGSFSEKQSGALVRRFFGSLPKQKKVGKEKTHEHQTRPRLLVKHKESDQSHLVLGVRAFPIFDKRRYALQALSDVLGGGMSSRLFHRIREELGAAYYIRTESELFLDHGYFAVSAGVDVARIELVIKVILEELRRARRELVSKDELQRAKDHLTGNFLMGLETSDELAGYYGGQEIITKSLVTPEMFVSRIQKVKAEEVRAVARALFVNANLNLAVIGPYKKPDFLKETFIF